MTQLISLKQLAPTRIKLQWPGSECHKTLNYEDTNTFNSQFPCSSKQKVNDDLHDLVEIFRKLTPSKRWFAQPLGVPLRQFYSVLSTLDSRFPSRKAFQILFHTLFQSFGRFRWRWMAGPRFSGKEITLLICLLIKDGDGSSSHWFLTFSRLAARVQVG